jgi:saccharopine dehydrogenase-like NADP-dependent oxidoreductase
MPAWGFGIDVDTGCPPSIAVQMIARGEITLRGALPAEQCIPTVPYFAELAKRNMRVRRPTPEAPRPTKRTHSVLTSQAN